MKKKINNELYHYGVKGMKWGIRKYLDKLRRRRTRRVNYDYDYDNDYDNENSNVESDRLTSYNAHTSRVLRNHNIAMVNGKSLSNSPVQVAVKRNNAKIFTNGPIEAKAAVRSSLTNTVKYSGKPMPVKYSGKSMASKDSSNPIPTNTVKYSGKPMAVKYSGKPMASKDSSNQIPTNTVTYSGKPMTLKEAIESGEIDEEKLTNILTNKGSLKVKKKKNTQNNGTLMHYGVKGMKWGVWNEETKSRYSHEGPIKRLKRLRRKINDTSMSIANVATLGAINEIKARERNYQNSEHKTPTTKFGMGVRAGLRVGRFALNKLATNAEVNLATSLLTTLSTATGSPQIVAGAQVASTFIRKMGNLKVGLVTAYDIYGQARDTKNYMMYR